MTDQLIPDPRNARKHPERNQDIIRQSLEEVGPFRSIAVDGDNVIRAGNGVFEQAQKLGMKVRIIEAAPDELIAVKRPDLTGAAAEKAALYDNRAGETSEWDADIIALLDQEGDLLEGVFDPAEIESILEEKAQMDQVRAEIEGGQVERDMAAFMQRDRTRIRPVLFSDQLPTFERAIHATGLENRGEALIALCSFYLENHREEDPAEQG